MKHLFFVFLLLASTSLYAQSDDALNQSKGRILKKLDERIELLTKLRECINTGATKKELKACSAKFAPTPKFNKERTR